MNFRSVFMEKDDRGRYPVCTIVAFVIGGFALAALFAFLFGWVAMLLWNWLMPDIFGLPRIGYWQAWGLVLLAHILIKPGYGHGGDHGHGPRQRDEWKARFKTRSGENAAADTATESTPTDI